MLGGGLVAFGQRGQGREDERYNLPPSLPFPYLTNFATRSELCSSCIRSQDWI